MTGRAVVGRRRGDRAQAQGACRRDARMRGRRPRAAPGGAVGDEGRAPHEVTFRQISGRAHWAAGGPIIGTHGLVFDRAPFDPKRAVATGLPFAQSACSASAPSASRSRSTRRPARSRVRARLVGATTSAARSTGRWREARSRARFVQGMGYALTEEMNWDGGPADQPDLDGLQDPGVPELPDEIHAIVVEDRRSRPGRSAPRAWASSASTASRRHRQRRRRCDRRSPPPLPMTPERVLTRLAATESARP